MSQNFMVTFFLSIFSVLEHYGLNWIFEKCVKKKFLYLYSLLDFGHFKMSFSEK